MQFNLTTQQAIDAMIIGHICVCANDYINDADRIYRVFKSEKESEYYFESKIKNINEEWKRCDLSFCQIISTWAIYEEPKQSTPLIQFKENGIKIECYVAHNTSYGHDSYTARFWLENFKKQEECNDWRKALNTFMRLKSHPLAVVAEEQTKQYIIYVAPDEGLFGCSMYCMHLKLRELSPCFSTKEDAESAITDIGKENILHMFKTFQGIYE